MDGGRGVDRREEELRGCCVEHAAVSIVLGKNTEIPAVSHRGNWESTDDNKEEAQ